MEPIELRVKWTFDEFDEGFTLVRRRAVVRSYLIMGGWTCVMAFGAYRFYQAGGLAASVPLLFATVLFGTLTALTQWRYRTALRRVWKQTEALREESELTIDDVGLSWDAPSGDTRLNWSAFTHWVETPNQFVLFRGPKLPYPLPKRCFADAEVVDHVRDAFTQRIGTAQAT